jgi:hypothetical protein
MHTQAQSMRTQQQGLGSGSRSKFGEITTPNVAIIE